MKGEMSEISELLDQFEKSIRWGGWSNTVASYHIGAMRLLAAKVEALEKWRPSIDGNVTAKYLTDLHDRVEALENQSVVSGHLGAVPPLAPKGQDEKMPTAETGHHSEQTLVDCAAHARELSIAIEDLPASGQQTVCSIQASSLSQKLHALLRQAPALPEAQQKQGHVSQAAFFTRELQELTAKEQLAELSRLRDLVRWRDAEKEKPDLPGDYPTLHDWNRNGFTLSCTRYDGRWFGQGVSHWLALPPLPKETK